MKLWCKLHGITVKAKRGGGNRLYFYKNDKLIISWSFNDLLFYKLRFIIKQTKKAVKEANIW